MNQRSPGFWSRVLLVAVGGVGVVAMLSAGGDTPEVGRVEAVYAEPAERVEVRALSAGQTLGEVLAGTLDANEQQRLLMAFRVQASPRRMKVGTEITLRFLPDVGSEAPLHPLRGVDIALNPDETVRLTRAGGVWNSETVRTPTWIDTVYAAGEIETALYNAVVYNEALGSLPARDREQVIHKLDQIFQWQIDFSRQIQEGDSYRFALRREFRPDGSMRAGRIIAAELINSGKPLHAIFFDPTGEGHDTYYDLDGQSVRRAFLMKPLEFRRISSRFNPSRLHPILKTRRAHRGVDYAAARGTAIMATGDGVVTQRGPNGGLGNSVTIRHANGFETRYGHMTRVASGINVGTRVSQRQIIGYVGDTGQATGPHLHYEMWQSGRAIDPLGLDMPSGDPVPVDERARWTTEMMQRLALLERLPSPVDIRIALADRRADADGDSDVEGSDETR